MTELIILSAIVCASIFSIWTKPKKSSHTLFSVTYRMQRLTCSHVLQSWVSSAYMLQYWGIEDIILCRISLSHTEWNYFILVIWGEVYFVAFLAIHKWSAKSLSYLTFQSTKNAKFPSSACSPPDQFPLNGIHLWLNAITTSMMEKITSLSILAWMSVPIFLYSVESQIPCYLIKCGQHC